MAGFYRRLSVLPIVADRCLRANSHKEVFIMALSPIETSEVTRIPAAAPNEALAHFERLLSFETDCWDVHAALGTNTSGFVLLDVRGPDSFAAGHVPGAVNLPHRRINERNLAEYPPDTL